MTSLDPSHIPPFATSEKHVGGPAAVRPRSHSGSGSLSTAAIPDLRFEQGYLKSIAPYVHTRRIPNAHGGRESQEVIGVEWKQVLWITMRDQLVSPLIQGVVWGVAQLFIRPLFVNIRAFFGFSRRAPAVEDSTFKPSKPRGDGDFTRRLREWSKSLKEG